MLCGNPLYNETPLDSSWAQWWRRLTFTPTSMPLKQLTTPIPTTYSMKRTFPLRCNVDRRRVREPFACCRTVDAVPTYFSDTQWEVTKDVDMLWIGDRDKFDSKTNAIKHVLTLVTFLRPLPFTTHLRQFAITASHRRSAKGTLVLSGVLQPSSRVTLYTYKEHMPQAAAGPQHEVKFC
jgi:hypothetical protein